MSILAFARRPRWWACLLVSAALGCGGDSPSGPGGDPGGGGPVTPPVPAAVASVTVDPATSAAEVADTVRATATLRDAAGNVLTGRDVVWSAEFPAIASVQAGRIVALAPGTTHVSATSEGKTGTLTLTVVPANVVRLDVTPLNPSVPATKTLQLTATPRDKHGNPLTRPVGWSSGDTLIATIDATGMLTGRREGTVTLTTVSGGVITYTGATVTRAVVERVAFTAAKTSIPVGETTTLQLVAYDGAGNVLAGRPATITTADSTVATVANKVVTGKREGTVTLTADVEGVKESLAMTVTPARVARLAITLPGPSVPVNGTMKVSVVAYDLFGNVLPGRPVTLGSSNPAVATIDSAKTVHALSAGTTSLTAASEGATTSALLTVTAFGPPASLRAVSGDGQTGAAGGKVVAPFAVRVLDAYGNPVRGGSVTWQPSWLTNPGGSSTDSTGVAAYTPVLPIKAGVYTVRAWPAGAPPLSDSFTVTVTAAAPISLTLSPATRYVAIGQQVPFTVSGSDRYNNPVAITDAKWFTSLDGHASVTQAGVVTGVSRGDATLAVTGAGLSTQTTLHVYQGPDNTAPSVTKVAVTPDTVDARFAARYFDVLVTLYEAQTQIGAASIMVHTPSGAAKGPYACKFDAAYGTPNAYENYIYRCTVPVPAGAESGNWTVDSVTAGDGIGNSTTVTRSQIIMQLWESSALVIGS